MISNIRLYNDANPTIEEAITPPMALAITIPTSVEGVSIYVALSVFTFVDADQRRTIMRAMQGIAQRLTLTE